MNALKNHILYFICGLISVLAGMLLLTMLPPPQSLLIARLIALSPIIITLIISIFLWKQSKGFAAGVGIWIILIIYSFIFL